MSYKVSEILPGDRRRDASNVDVRLYRINVYRAGADHLRHPDALSIGIREVELLTDPLLEDVKVFGQADR